MDVLINTFNQIADANATASILDATAPTFSESSMDDWVNYLIDDRAYTSFIDTKRFIAFDRWKNHLILPDAAVESLPHFFASWLRNMVAGCALYYGVGLLWCLWIYVLNGRKYFPQSDIPDRKMLWKHITVSQKALVWYTLLPTVGEWLVERGHTMCYFSIGEYGWGKYLGFLFLYIVWVEFGIYWVHRLLHDIKWAYKWLHHDHHLYNSKDMLSPFAGLAFHPLDGILQASPYVVGIFFIPTHFLTHQALLFFTAVWTANIHDCLQSNLEPIMGASYHTYHHLYYKCNYGQFFIFWDWFYGTLRTPAGSSWGSFDSPKFVHANKKVL